MIGISQQELTHDKVTCMHEVVSWCHISCSLSFPSPRQKYLSLVKDGINLSGQVWDKSICQTNQ